MNNYASIAIDCDDVLVPTASAILAHYNKTYGTHIALEQLYSKDPKVWAVETYEQAVERVHAFLDTPEYQNVPPFKGAITVIAELAKKYELHIITARQDKLAEATKRMLAEHFPGIFKSIQFTNHFSGAAKTKAEVCQAIGANLLIDDHLNHAELAAKCGIDVLLFGDYPWNKADSFPPNITRVSNWNDVAQKLL